MVSLAITPTKMLTEQLSHDSFAMLILTHGRANKVFTIKTLKDSGYTGRVVIVIDNEDKHADEYREIYGSQVYQFDKLAVAAYTDEGYHDHKDRRSITYARNVSFQVAKELGLSHFMMLDDDYTDFYYRFDGNRKYTKKHILNMDNVLDAMLTFYKRIPSLSIAFAQGGDFAGGEQGGYARKINLLRKCMNTFLCSVDRHYQFSGVFNEDVNTYTVLSQRGNLFFSVVQVYVDQKRTQSNSGGITELYLKFGTYIKAFYSVMYSPSSVKVSTLNDRIHHRINWNYTAPKILHQRHQKA